MDETIKVGPSRDEVVEKYRAKFHALPVLTKVKVIVRTFVALIATQITACLYALKILKAPEISDNAEVDLRPSAHPNRTGEHHLNDDEIAFFNENGYIPPFKVIERDDALALNRTIRDSVMSGTIVYGPYPDMDNRERQPKMAEVGLRDDLELRSWNRHFNIPDVYDLLASAPITRRLASLFGRDVYLWRSQLFPLPSGGRGTALHQVTDFRFAMNKTVLSPGPDVPQSLVNLTTWIALTDVDESSGAMILVEGSHKNNRFEQYALNAKYYLCRTPLLSRALILFVRNVANDGHARFDVVNLFIKEVEKFDNQLFDKSKFVTLTMKAGEAIIFTSRTIHGSHPNTNETERLALGGRYTTSAVEVYPDDGEYREVKHFAPLEPVILDKYKKTFKVCSVE